MVTENGSDWVEEGDATELDQGYLMKAVQEPGRVTLVAGILRGYSNKLWQSTNGDEWTELSVHAQFSPRLYARGVGFNGQMWLIGGAVLDQIDTNEIWRSSDGLNWSRVTPATAVFSPRDNHRVVVFNDRLWVIGGWDNLLSVGGTETRLNEVWSSADGVNWTQHPNAGFSPRVAFDAAVFDGKMWVIGGDSQAEPFLNDVWSTLDGVTWTQETPAAQFSPRRNHSIVAHNGALWVIGGGDATTTDVGLDEVWRSTNGVAWAQVAAGPRFTPRLGAGVVSLNDRLVVVAGVGGGERHNDVWSSSDGVTWTEETADAGFEKRFHHGLINYNDELYVIGGFALTRFNDVWRSSDGGANWSVGFSHELTPP
jgi:Kelch motif